MSSSDVNPANPQVCYLCIPITGMSVATVFISLSYVAQDSQSLVVINRTFQSMDLHRPLQQSRGATTIK